MIVFAVLHAISQTDSFGAARLAEAWQSLRQLGTCKRSTKFR